MIEDLNGCKIIDCLVDSLSASEDIRRISEGYQKDIRRISGGYQEKGFLECIN